MALTICNSPTLVTDKGRWVQAQSMPLHGTVGQLLNRLIAAGVGQRPVIFVTHR